MGAGVLQPEPSRCYLYVGRMDFQGTTAWLYFCCSHCVYSCCRDGEAHMEVRGQLVRSVLSGSNPACQAGLAALFGDSYIFRN